MKDIKAWKVIEEETVNLTGTSQEKERERDHTILISPLPVPGSENRDSKVTRISSLHQRSYRETTS